MRRPEDLELSFPSEGLVHFRTACGTAAGTALWKDWGYAETMYRTAALKLLDGGDGEELSASICAASDEPGHFRVIGAVTVNMGWCFHVESLGFRFEIDASELEELGLEGLVVPPEVESEMAQFKDGVLVQGTWVQVEVRDLSL